MSRSCDCHAPCLFAMQACLHPLYACFEFACCLPACCAQRTHNRPLSPDVLEIDNKSPHYKFPLGALSSITNRVTGVVMSFGEQA